VEYVDALDLHTMTKQVKKNYHYQSFGLSLKKTYNKNNWLSRQEKATFISTVGHANIF